MYSDNVDLQRSASLTFAEITERGDTLYFHPFLTRVWVTDGWDLVFRRPGGGS